MTFNVNLTPEQEQAWREAAAWRGISVDDLVDEVLRKDLGLPPTSYPAWQEAQEPQSLGQQ